MIQLAPAISGVLFLDRGWGSVYRCSHLIPFIRTTRFEGELTSVQTSQDSQYALINHAPNVRYPAFCKIYILAYGNLLILGGAYVGPKYWTGSAQI